MLDRVLDERLEQKRRHARRADARIDFHGDPDAIAEPRPLDVRVLLQDRELLVDRDELAGLRLQARAKEVGELKDHALGAPRIRVDVGQDGVESVEEEVRTQLSAQRVQLRLGELRPQPLALAQPDAPAPDATASDGGDDAEAAARRNGVVS